MKKLSDEVLNQRFTTYENLHELYKQFQYRLLANETLPINVRTDLLTALEKNIAQVTFENMTSFEDIQQLIRTYEAFRNTLIDLHLIESEKLVYTI